MSRIANLTLPEKVIEHVKVSAVLSDKATAAARIAQEKQAAVKALINDVCDAMVQNERVEASQRDKLAALLEDPVEVLKILQKTAGHRNTSEATTLGHGVDGDGSTKTAAAKGGYNSLNSPHVGRRDTMEKESSARLFSGLGITPKAQATA